MKKVIMILIAGMALAACGSGSDRSEAARDDYDNTTDQQTVYPDDMEGIDQDTSSNSMRTDTTSFDNSGGLDNNNLDNSNLNNNDIDNSRLDDNNLQSSDSLSR